MFIFLLKTFAESCFGIYVYTDFFNSDILSLYRKKNRSFFVTNIYVYFKTNFRKLYLPNMLEIKLYIVEARI